MKIKWIGILILFRLPGMSPYQLALQGLRWSFSCPFTDCDWRVLIQTEHQTEINGKGSLISCTQMSRVESMRISSSGPFVILVIINMYIKLSLRRTLPPKIIILGLIKNLFGTLWKPDDHCQWQIEYFVILLKAVYWTMKITSIATI